MKIAASLIAAALMAGVTRARSLPLARSVWINDYGAESLPPKVRNWLAHPKADNFFDATLGAMIDALSAMRRGLIHDGWLELITVKDKNGLHNYRAPVFSVWGGYGGTNDARTAKQRD